jgi:hypothetical protein
MNNKIISILFAFIVFGNTQMLAQNNDNCLEFLTNYNNHLSDIQKISGDSVLVLSYSVVNMLNDYSIPTSDSICMIISDKMIQYNSGYFDLFQDTKNSFVILKSPRKILINNSSMREGKYRDLSHITMFRDSVLDRCTVEKCTDIVSPENIKQRNIQLAFDDKLRDAMNISRQKLYFNLDSGLLEKLITIYSPGSEYKRTTIKIHELVIKNKKRLNTTATERVFARNGKLLSQYKGFKIIDNRVN